MSETVDKAMDEQGQHDDRGSEAAGQATPTAILVLKLIWRPLVVLLLIGLLVWLAKPGQIVTEVAEWREAIQALGAWGVVLFLTVYVIAAVAIVPAAVLKVAAGGLFGSLMGVVVASIGSTLGAAACFLIARYMTRGALATWLRRQERFRRLDTLTRHHGAVIVALVRLIPILPGNLVNYAFGLLRVPFWTYVFWTWLCMLPGIVVLVVGTDALLQGIYEGRVPWGLIGVVISALVMLGIAMLFAHRKFRQRQKRGEVSYTDL